MPSRKEVDDAAQVLRQGGLVAFPTETVYGLGADAENEAAVRRVFEVKGRPADHPLIVHLAEPSQMDGWAQEIPDAARKLAARFWPGPLTLILPRGPRAKDVVTGGQKTVGLRVPAHPLALALLRAFGGGIAAPSANRFGAVSPTTAEHVRNDLGALIEYVLDGGPCDVGIESTIVDVSGDAPRILRPGGITREAIEAALGRSVPVLGITREVRVSGQLASHYAPRAEVRIVEHAGLDDMVRREQEGGRRVGVMLRGSEAHASNADVTVLLPGDEAELARELYKALRHLDEQHVDVVLTTLPSETGLGLAISDRLKKAAGPRER